ncbi:helicase/secretion neighborhood TadE-like protein [Microbacterium sp. RU33B]|nr:helicase/secretion neighborhood TadE-like protein [Microbacterium sp. RU33B]
MAGTMLAAGVIGCTASLALGLSTVAGAAVLGQRLAGAADAAALAAADAASGAVEGTPCERAAELAAHAGVMVSRCDLDGLVATITVSTRYLGFAAGATARAGPAPGSQ